MLSGLNPGLESRMRFSFRRRITRYSRRRKEDTLKMHFLNPSQSFWNTLAQALKKMAFGRQKCYLRFNEEADCRNNSIAIDTVQWGSMNPGVHSPEYFGYFRQLGDPGIMCIPEDPVPGSYASSTTFAVAMLAAAKARIVTRAVIFMMML